MYRIYQSISSSRLEGAVDYADCIFAEAKEPSNECPGYDTKQSDDEASVLKLWGMGSTSSLPLLSVLLWPGVVVSVLVPSMRQIQLFNHLTVCKQITDIE